MSTASIKDRTSITTDKETLALLRKNVPDGNVSRFLRDLVRQVEYQQAEAGTALPTEAMIANLRVTVNRLDERVSKRLERLVDTVSRLKTQVESLNNRLLFIEGYICAEIESVDLEPKIKSDWEKFKSKQDNEAHEAFNGK